MDEEKTNECCSGGTRLIFACSGASDVGEIADRSARKMMKNGLGKMFCLAGVGGCVGPVMDGTKAASKILAIDGCPLNCVKNSLEHAGLKNFKHIQLGEIGMEKFNSPVTDERIDKV
ncbi:unnamed protein product, partial [marine sediment metagenome]